MRFSLPKARLSERFEKFARYRHHRRRLDYLRLLKGSSHPRLRYIGWLGHRNVGDEALYEAFKNRLCTRALLLPFEDFSPVSVMARLSGSCQVVLGGGTLINTDSFLWQLERGRATGQEIVVFGTGVSDMSFWADHPGHGRGSSDSWVALLKCARYVGVRGPRSLRWMHANGITRAEMIGDPALHCVPPLDRKQPGARCVVGINLGSHDPVSGGQDRTTEALVALTRRLLARRMEVRFVALNDIDHDIGRQLVAQVGDPGFSLQPFSCIVGESLRQLAACDFVVGQRLHVTVLASALAIPNLSLSYQPKCLDFLESIDCADLAVPTETISGELLIERFTALESRYGEWHQRLIERCRGLRELQEQRARELGWM